jgi:pyrimidine-nucleoside phosphorylase
VDSIPAPALIIARKRDGLKLSGEEIGSFVRGAGDGSWPDYQLAALLMAITLRGMSAEETADLTAAVLHSGVVADLSAVRLPKIDKHSTGGVGDKISLLLAPMVACCGVAVPMISGRGLGHTGGTLDKLESIRGFRVGLTLAEFRAQVERIGVAIIGQTAELAPADKKLYALRDLTGTVECLPLICASIMGKKLAAGLDAIVLDVKFGGGAFMPDQARAQELARAMVAIGKAMARPVRAVLTRMDEPLGHTVGNALEVGETIASLRGQGPADVMEVTYALGAQMLLLAGVTASAEQARARLAAGLASGQALAKFREMVAAQGGDVGQIDDPMRLPQAQLKVWLPAAKGGTVQAVDARAIALATLRLGAGRLRTEDAVDPAVGVSHLVKVGDRVASGQPLCAIHASSEAALASAQGQIVAAIALGDQPVLPFPLIAEIIG